MKNLLFAMLLPFAVFADNIPASIGGYDFGSPLKNRGLKGVSGSAVPDNFGRLDVYKPLKLKQAFLSFDSVLLGYSRSTGLLEEVCFSRSFSRFSSYVSITNTFADTERQLSSLFNCKMVRSALSDSRSLLSTAFVTDWQCRLRAYCKDERDLAGVRPRWFMDLFVIVPSKSISQK